MVRYTLESAVEGWKTKAKKDQQEMRLVSRHCLRRSG